MKIFLKNARILLIGLIFLTVTYYISKICLSFGMRISFEKGVRLLAEILTVTASLTAGLLLAPASASVLHKSEYKRYMLYITALLAVFLLITWKLWFTPEWMMTHQTLDPQFLTLSFTIPGVLSHFATLFFILRKHQSSEKKGQAPTKEI